MTEEEIRKDEREKMMRPYSLELAKARCEAVAKWRSQSTTEEVNSVINRMIADWEALRV